MLAPGLQRRAPEAVSRVRGYAAAMERGHLADTAGCPACGGPLTPWLRAPAAEAGAPPVALLRCTICASARTVGAARDDAHETGDYAPGRPRGAHAAAPILAAFDRRRLALLRRALPPPARLLDVGAGRGRFVVAASAAGYAAEGLEPSTRGVRAAREEYGVKLGQSGVEEATVPAGSFDALSLWHVLEHLEDPRAALRTLRGWLAPGGVLLVGVPNLDSWQARLAAERWYHLDLPRHRTHFSPRGLATLLEETGFEVERVEHVLAEHNPLGMWLAVANRVTRRPNYLYHLLKRSAPVRSRDLPMTLLALPLVPFAVAVELLAGVCRRGGTVAVIARVV